jgi:hypothetical protein
LDKKRTGKRYAEFVFFNPVEFADHVCAFWCVRGAKRDLTNFHAWVGPVRIRQKAHPVRLGHKMSMDYFSCSGGLGAVSIWSPPGHVMQNLCFGTW